MNTLSYNVLEYILRMSTLVVLVMEIVQSYYSKVSVTIIICGFTFCGLVCLRVLTTVY